MRALFCIALLFTTCTAWAQVRLNVSVTSPPFLEIVDIGRRQYYNNTTKNGLSPGLELDNLFAREKDGLKLHFSIGAYYTTQSFTAGNYTDTGTYFYNGYNYPYSENQVSQINTKLINIPIMARGSFKISELVENNRVGFELGIVTSAFLSYHLAEAASLTYDSANYYGLYQSYATDQANLANGLGSKFTFKVVGGIFVYVNRFFISGRFDIASLSNLYAKQFNANTWQVPPGYSLYQQASTEGRMKNSFATIVVSYRITSK